MVFEMAADTSVIGLSGEATLSAFSISRPAILSPRPYSSRVSSAQFHVMQYKDRAQCSGPSQFEKFPNIQNLEILQSNGMKKSSNKVPLTSDKESAFPNFRLLQRLAASAKARISNDVTTTEGKQIAKNTVAEIKETETQDATVEVSLQDVLSSSLPPSVKIPSPPPDDIKDYNGRTQMKRPKSRRKHRRLITKKQGKQKPSESGHISSFHLLQPSSSKIIPTFSQRFKKQRDRQVRKKATSKVGQPSSNSFSNGYYFSLSAYPEVLEISKAETSVTDVDDQTSCNADLKGNRNVVKEAKLRAIYHSSQDLNSSTSNSLNKVKLKKVFQSEKQSGSISQCGRLLPCAPPTSPTPQTLEKYEFVPSLADLRSQQTVKQRLAALEKENKRKQQANEQDKKRKESQLLQERCKAERIRHRQEIYALNKIMTKLEKDHFTNFKEKKGVR